MTDWADVYRSTYADVVRFLFRKVWDPERAQELAQDTYARVLDRHADNPRALLFTVAANLARDEARTVVRRKKHLALLRSESDAMSNDARDEQEHAQQVADVRACLDRLSERDREVLLLWDAGLSYDDIAAQTGLAVSAVGTTLARARKRLVEAYSRTEGQDHAARR